MKGFVFGGLHDALLWKEEIFGISEEEEARRRRAESAISQTKFEILRREDDAFLFRENSSGGLTSFPIYSQ